VLDGRRKMDWERAKSLDYYRVKIDFKHILNIS